MKDTEKNIELKSEELQDIIGHIPSSIVRWGITIIFLTLLILFVGSAFFKYPDIISSTIIITTENPPASVLARTNGKIDKILVFDKQLVKENEILAIISNTANYKDVIYVSHLLDSIQLNSLFFDTSIVKYFDKNLILGEIQTNYNLLKKNYSDYYNFCYLNYHKNKIEAIKSEINVIQEFISSQKSQNNIIESELQIYKKQVFRDSSLVLTGAISQAEFEITQSNFLQKKYILQNAKTNLINSKVQISQLLQSIFDLELAYKNEKNLLESELLKSFDLLENNIIQWEYNYILRTPINGYISFSKVWSENQNVIAGDIVFNIMPEKQSKLTGRLQLPINGAGKVKINQLVNIKFSNYPYMEYGMVKGKIISISPIATENYYLVLVELPDSLITNYNKKLVFTQDMTGVAEIITDNKSLLSRLFSPLKYIKEKLK